MSGISTSFEASLEVRPAMLDDVGELRSVAMLVHQQSPVFRNITFDDASISSFLSSAILDKDNYFAYVVVNSGKIVGTMIGVLQPFYFSAQKMASELVIIVDEKFRGSRAGYYLIKKFEAWGVEKGATHVHVGVSLGIDDAKASEFFTRSGYSPAGSDFLKEIV